MTNYLDKINVNHVLTDEESTVCEGRITKGECERSLNTISSDKAPGYDGLSIEFYRHFWNEIGDMVVNSYNEAFESCNLAESHKLSILSLIFKKGDRDDLKNYRPISLSNTDYKLLASVLADRLQKVVSKVIGDEQTAYIKGRFSGENIRLVLDIMEYTKEKNVPGLLLFLDFQKAFDSLHWNFIQECLKKLGFKNDFCRWIRTIYNSPIALLKINGFISGKIPLFKGIRQGCPLSALLFIICTEFLSQKLYGNHEFHGIYYESMGQQREVKCTQYADDTCIFLSNIDDIEKCLQEVQDFSKVSGLNLNLHKTEGLCIGSLANTYPAMHTIKWPHKPIRYLGIHIGNNLFECQKNNWINKIEKIQKLIDCWRKRHLSLIGKILIIKTLALPKLIYPATFLSVPDGFIKKINKILYNFIWGVRDKIQRRIIKNSISKGGLQMVDVESQFFAVKAAWITRMLKNNNKNWSFLFEYFLSKFAVNGSVLKMNFVEKKQMPRLTALPTFYQEAILGFCKSNSCISVNSKSDLYNQFIWGNRLFTINRKCLYSKSFIQSNILYVRDVLDQNGKFRIGLYAQLQNKQYYFRVITQISQSLWQYADYRYADVPYHIAPDNDAANILNKKTKCFYNNIIKQKVLLPKTTNKWNMEFNMEINWSLIAQNKLKKQLQVKISEFNFKVLHNILANNDNLFKWQKSPSSSCIYCDQPIHNTKHLLWECLPAANLWQNISRILNVNISWQDIIIGSDRDQILNLVTSLISYLIYKKFLGDKDKANFVNNNLNFFVKQELIKRNETYNICTSKQNVCPILSLISSSL